MITITSETSKAFYNLLEEELNKANKELFDAKSSVKYYENRITKLRILKLSINENICKSCNGIGQVRNFIAQDESRIEKCDSCKGKGYFDA